MFDPMMAYQTFDSTSLTELPRGGILGRIKSSGSYKSLDKWATDKYTKQTMSHTLEEPLLQLTQRGPTLTVERHLLLFFATTLAAAISHAFGRDDIARWLMTGLAVFTVAVRSMISAIMRIKW